MSKVQVAIVGDRINVRSGYEHRDICKAIPGRRWEPADKRWSYPATSTAAVNIVEFFTAAGVAIDIDPDDRFHNLVQAAKNRQAILDDPKRWQHATAIEPKTKPMAHQVFGTHLVAASDGCMLLWEMGTGKTKAVIDAICAYGLHRVLVICPLNVIGQWRREIEKHAATRIDLHTMDAGSVVEKSVLMSTALEHHRGAKAALVFVINYESIWRPPLGPRYEQLGRARRRRVDDGMLLNWQDRHEPDNATPWDLIVCDEIHRIKDPRGRASTFLAELGARSRRRVGLTGTFMPRDPLDAWAQMRFIDAGVFAANYGAFKRHYAVLGGWQGKVTMGFQNTDELHDRIYKVAHRVTKAEVLDLPDIVHVERPVALCQKAWDLYAALEDELLVEFEEGTIDVSNALVELLRLQQLTSGYISIETGRDASGRAERVLRMVDTAKRDSLGEIMQDLPTTEPLVVFCRFLQDLVTISVLADQSNRPYYEISGARKERDGWEEAAKAGKGAILGVQIKAGGLGVDLTDAAFCVFYSLGFEWGDFDQALARLHRHGQNRKVTYLHLIAQGTVDETVYASMQRKEHVVRAVLDRLRYHKPTRRRRHSGHALKTK